MKKLIFLLIVSGIIYLSIVNLNDKFIIPKEAIRLRVVPNSNSEEDVQLKLKVSNHLQKQMSIMLNEVIEIGEARTIINNNYNEVVQGIDNLLKQEQYLVPYQLNFGYNYFPAKEYKGVVYKEGYYESLLVTLGEGLGDNWWCVLFPPLCLIEATDESTEVEYKSFVAEFFSKYFN